MLNVLLKKQLTEIFRSYFYDAKKNKARSKGAIIGYILLFAVLMVGVLGGMFTMLSLSMCAALSDVGMDWLYFALMALLATLLGAFGSVFNTYSGLYLAKDNDLLLSMPIPVGTIMLSRLLSVYLLGLLYTAVVILPAVIVYWAVVSAAAGAIIGGILLVLLLSLFVMTLSCALGWVVAKISLKLKNKSFITVLVSLLFLGGYYFFYFNAQTLLTQLLANAALYGTKIKGAAYPLYLLGRVGTGDPLAMLATTAFILVLFGLLWRLLSRSFLRIATSSGSTAKRRYREQAVRQRSVDAALLTRELAHFTASPNYMLNCGLGVLLLPLAGGALLWKGGDLLTLAELLFADKDGCVLALLCAAVCTLASMNDMAAPSVSLEGKNLWLAQSLPVTAWQVLRAKLRMQLLLTGIPALFCLLCIALVYPCTAAELMLAVLVSLLYALLSALAGLFLGLKMPNLTWTREITPIKQSGCVLLALFGGWLYALLLGGGYLLAGWQLGFTLYMILWAAATLLLCVVLLRWLKKQGAAIFAAL